MVMAWVLSRKGKSQEKASVVFDGSSGNSLHFGGWGNLMAHHPSQQREPVYSFHPHTMNLVLGLIRIRLPCLAIFPTLLKKDLILAGSNFVTVDLKKNLNRMKREYLV